MKTYFYLIPLFFLVACAPGESGPSLQEVQENVYVGIETPSRERDFSYNNNGDYGVYEIPADPKTFKGIITVTEGFTVSHNSLTVRWRSDIEGELFAAHPDENFESTFTTPLSKGLHKIYMEVYLGNNTQLVQKDSIMVSNVIKLEAAPRLGRIMRLNWTKYEGSNFVSYLVYHDDFTPVAEITDINTLQYDLAETHTLGDAHPYQIVVKTDNPNWTNETMGSNIVSKITGDFLTIPYYIRKMVKDPIRPRLYAICSPRDLDEVADKYGVIIINTNSFTIEDHILINYRCTDVDVSPDGQYMYLTQRHVDNILRVNLNTYSYGSITTHTSGYGFDDVEAGNNNLLYANPYNSTSPGQMINALTWVYTVAQSSLSVGEMAYNPMNDILYMAGNTSSSNLYKMNATNWASGNYLTLTQFPQYPGGVGYPYPKLIISDDGNHIFWDKYQLDSNFTVERQFSDSVFIHGCSPSNQFICDWGKVYDFNTMNTVLTLPSFGNYEFYDTDFYFTDENTIFTEKTYDPNDGNPSYTYLFRIKLN